REPVPVAVVCDGAGNAEQTARKTLKLFQLWIHDASSEQILTPETWTKWVKMLDSSLLGGYESTFLAATVLNDQLIGASAGDSRAYLVGSEGGYRFITASSNKMRLGSGEVKPFTFSLTLKHKDIVLLMTDGAWTPLSPYLIEKTTRKAALEHFSEVPTALLNIASKTGRWDDMTVVALRLTRC
ncbi:MAG: SpoIIE family protein phosphatase, partial [Deltaproteobacteria bacterium]|nr:SpoIIE family protein phosphatase [Deltaproteobacteria bacterium]